MTTEQLIQMYYQSLNKKDTTWQQLWSENAIFSDSSQALIAKGKPEIIQSFTTFLKGMKSVKVKHLIVSGNDVCAILQYEYVNSKGEKMMQEDAEVWEIKDGKLDRMTIYFDLTAYRSFMRRQSNKKSEHPLPLGAFRQAQHKQIILRYASDILAV